MNDGTDPEKAAKAWVHAGAGDFRSAELLLDANPPEPATAAFHAQQAAEKFLKAFLTYHGDEPPNIHDLPTLLDLVDDHETVTDDLYDDAEFLAPFAVAVRYPFTGSAPTPPEATRALHAAERIGEFARSHLP